MKTATGSSRDTDLLTDIRDAFNEANRNNVSIYASIRAGWRRSSSTSTKASAEQMEPRCYA